MGNIINDIVEDVNIKPNNSKIIIKWIVSISITLIGLAFAFGQFKASFFNRMDGFEEALNKNTAVIEQLNDEMNNKFSDVNARIDKGYNDGLTTLQDYQEFNKKQLILVLDYGQSNKELLKEMLEMNAQEKTRDVANQMMQSKNESTFSIENPNLSIGVRRVDENLGGEYISIEYRIERETNDTIFSVVGATKNFINKINTNEYKLGAVIENHNNPNLYDFTYRKIK